MASRFLAFKVDKFVLLYGELRLYIFWLRFHIDASHHEVQIDQLSSIQSCELLKHGIGSPFAALIASTRVSEFIAPTDPAIRLISKLSAHLKARHPVAHS
jgi:hypothetical protein